MFARSLLLLALGGALLTGAAAQVTFVDVTAAAGVVYTHGNLQPADFDEPVALSGGAAATDFDGDGWVDLFVTRYEERDILFRNRGVSGGVHRGFEDVSALAFPQGPPGPQSNGAVWGDIDNDGDADLFVTSLHTRRYQLFINDGAGGFTEQGIARGAGVLNDRDHLGTSPTFGDYDKDGYLDLYVAEWGQLYQPGLASNARLLRNRGAAQPGFFEDVTVAAGVVIDDDQGSGPQFSAQGALAFAPRFSDLDDDGWLDLALVGDFGTSHLFWNQGNGTFIDGTAAAGVGTDENGMGSAIADFNGDGRLDWFVTSIYDPLNSCVSPGCNWFSSGNRLYLNAGGRTFVDRTDAAGVRDGGWGWAAVAFDYDHDGDLDLSMTNGIEFPQALDDPFNSDPMKLWRNDGTFTEVAAQVGLTATGPGKGMLTLDYDRDGDLDLFVVHNGAEPILYENQGGDSAGDWLQLELQGSTSNRDAAGARVLLTVERGGAEQLRETSLGSNYLAQDEPLVHFGLGTPGPTPVHRLEVRWPSGQVTVLSDVTRNRRILVVEP